MPIAKLLKNLAPFQISIRRVLLIPFPFFVAMTLGGRTQAQDTAGAKQAPAILGDAAAGKSIYERYCSPCHGIGGGGGKGPRLNRARLPHAQDDNELRAVITNGIPPGMPDAWYLTNEEIANVAAHIRTLGKTPQEKVPGDSKRGAAVYARSGCAGCHIYAGKGVGFGPELTDVGDRRNATYIQKAIRNPSSALPEGFLMVTVVTNAAQGAGQKIQGIRLNEDTFTIQIKDAGGHIYSFRKSDLKDLQKETGQTPMPAFEKVLQAEDLQDLVAFLVDSRVAQ
jgi:putative heme-binding domain-containing protein